MSRAKFGPKIEQRCITREKQTWQSETLRSRVLPRTKTWSPFFCHALPRSDLMGLSCLWSSVPLCLLFKTVECHKWKSNFPESVASESATTPRSIGFCLRLLFLCLQLPQSTDAGWRTRNWGIQETELLIGYKDELLSQRHLLKSFDWHSTLSSELQSRWSYSRNCFRGRNNFTSWNKCKWVWPKEQLDKPPKQEA